MIVELMAKFNNKVKSASTGSVKRKSGDWH